MVLSLVTIISFLIAVISFFVYKINNRKSLIGPISVFLLSDFFYFYAKYCVTANLYTPIFFVLASLFCIGAICYICIILFNDNVTKRNLIPLIARLILTIIIFFLPSLGTEGRFRLYQDEYFSVANSLFDFYDNGNYTDYKGIELKNNEGTLRNSFNNDVLSEINVLVSHSNIPYASVCKDAVYFYFRDNTIQSEVDGIAIFRSEENPKDNVIHKLYDILYYTEIKKNVYYFYGE